MLKTKVSAVIYLYNKNIEEPTILQLAVNLFFLRLPGGSGNRTIEFHGKKNSLISISATSSFYGLTHS